MGLHAPRTLGARRRKEIAGLARRKGRDALGQFLVEGVRSVRSAVEAGADLVEIVVTGEALGRPEVAALAVRASVPVLLAASADLDRIGDAATSQGVVGVARIRRAPLAALPAGERVLVLDGIQDPGNVGTILRTAAWFGIRHAVCGPGTADRFAPKVVRSSMGALWDLEVADSEDLGPLVDGWLGKGRTVWVADLQGTPLQEWPGADVLILGSEGHGPLPEIRRAATGAVTIGPARALHGTESLNVAAAAAVLLHAWAATP